MRAKIKFPHRTRPIEREVREWKGKHYIKSKGLIVPVVANGIEWEIAEGWRWLYEKAQVN